MAIREALFLIRQAREEERSELILAGCEIEALPSEVGSLANLTQLDLQDNQLTSLPPEIGSLTNLTTLDLSVNRLTSLPPEIGSLANLTTLDLRGNQLTSLPPEIGSLANLTDLNLSGNQLTSLPPEIGSLANLTELSLWRNQLTSLPPEIGLLADLTEFDVSSNQLARLLSEISNLTNLTTLVAARNQLTSLPLEIGSLANLTELDLSDNQLPSLPSEIGSLANLTDLNLSGNQLTSLPAEIGTLADLRTLQLACNRLDSLPPGIGELTKLAHLDLRENQLDMPAEVLDRTTEPKAILDYYLRVAAGRKPLNEAKLVFIGHGEVGKTSLVNRLVHDVFKKEKKTMGIEITDWPIELRGSEEILLHVWDFGGQEIMHATHRFFLTQRSVYVIVLNARQGHEDRDAEYWLSLVKGLAGNSPVIVVLNKIGSHPFDLNRRALRQKYSNIRTFVETDCEDGTSIQELREAIHRETDRLEHLRDAFPASWLSIKERLAGMEEDYLSFGQYQKICAELNEPETAGQESLAGFLHDLGIALNYRDDPRLSDTLVLNPRWVTHGIYTILTSEYIASEKGELRVSDLTQVLPQDSYPRERHYFLLDLMRRFDLCFRFPEDDDRYLIPELLDRQQPAEVGSFPYDDSLNFQYHYSVLPEGLLPRFIVRTHVLSTGQPRWHSGVILRFEANSALVVADAIDKRVSTSVTGPRAGRRRLLATIRSDFEHIHRSYAFAVKEMVAVPGYIDALIPYGKLLAMEASDIRTVTEVIDGAVVLLNVKELLNGVDLEGTRVRSASRVVGKAARLFLSYSHKDEALRGEFETHLKLLQRQGVIECWHDRRITAGEEWTGDIDENLEQADIVLLLVSSDFIASDYCYDTEMIRAMERHEAGNATVIPVIVRNVAWHSAPFGKLQAIPSSGKAVTMWSDRDSAWRSVASGIEMFVRRLKESASEADPLHIARIQVKNMRCIKDMDIDLASQSGAKQFILLLGDNAVGKTTLLRCIAMAMADKTSAVAMLDDMTGDLIRHNEHESSIHVEFARQREEDRHYLTTTLHLDPNTGEVSLRHKASTGFPRQELFVCGYGAARSGFGTEDQSRYEVADAVRTLFDYSVSLQNPELALRRAGSRGMSINSLAHRIDAMLMLNEGSLRIDDSGIAICGPWGDFVPSGATGDGFHSTLGWIADLFGWVALFSAETLRTEVSGIVLIDELEKHLHPRWQRHFIRLLCQQFPKLQFIAATHSPICASGLADVENEESVILLRLVRDDGQAVTVQRIESLKGMRYDQVLVSEAFGLTSTRDTTTETLIERLRQAHRSGDEARVNDALKELRSCSVSAAEDERERHTQEALTRELADVRKLLEGDSEK